MSQVGSLACSVASAFTQGFSTLNRAAQEMTGGTTPATTVATTPGDDPMISGVMDLSTAKMEVGAGAALLKTYRDTTGTLLDMMG